MQSKLATWSTENKERKFDRLLRLVADKNWLSEAARITLASSGARTPGVDGVDKRMMEANLQHELATIREELRGARTDRCQHVECTYRKRTASSGHLAF